MMHFYYKTEQLQEKKKKESPRFYRVFEITKSSSCLFMCSFQGVFWSHSEVRGAALAGVICLLSNKPAHKSGPQSYASISASRLRLFIRQV